MEEFLEQIHFRGDIEDPIQGKIGFYGIFESVCKEYLNSDDKKYAEGWGNHLEEVLSHSITILDNLVKCRDLFHPP